MLRSLTDFDLAGRCHGSRLAPAFSSHGCRLEAALADCRTDSPSRPTGTMEEIAARHGVDPFDLCEAWLDDPARMHPAPFRMLATALINTRIWQSRR